MHNLHIILAALLAASAQAGAAKSKIKPTPTPYYPSSPPSSSCTITSTLEQSECCPQIPATTTYAFTECNGCALVTETVPLACFAPCTVEPTVDAALTRTVTECDQVMSILPIETVKIKKSH